MYIKVSYFIINTYQALNSFLDSETTQEEPNI